MSFAALSPARPSYTAPGSANRSARAGPLSLRPELHSRSVRLNLRISGAIIARLKRHGGYYNFKRPHRRRRSRCATPRTRGSTVPATTTTASAATPVITIASSRWSGSCSERAVFLSKKRGLGCRSRSPRIASACQLSSRRLRRVLRGVGRSWARCPAAPLHRETLDLSATQTGWLVATPRCS